MKKKLLILIDTLKPMVDGVSTFLDGTMSYLSEKYRVTVIAPDYGETSYSDINLIQFPIFKYKLTAYGFPKINRKIIKREVKTADFILNHESILPLSTSFYALNYAKKYKKPFFTYIHTLDWELPTEIIRMPNFVRKFGRFLFKIYGKWFLNNCTVILVSFPTIEKILRENRVQGRFERVPIGISDIFEPGKSTFSFNDKTVIGYVGRVSREKGLEKLYKAFLTLDSKFDNLFLLIVGDGLDKDIFKGDRNIKITGFVSHEEVAEYLKAIDIFVLPSVTEANSLSTLEAMKAGVCCVTRDVGAIKDYLKHGHSGYLFDEEEELVDILEKLIINEKLRKEMGRNARESVLKYTWENTSDLIIKVIENNS